MELQKRQRIETANRFQKHLDRVMEILQQAIQNLPEPMDLDSKIMIETDLMVRQKKMDKNETNSDPCDIKDRVMCSIVDKMLWIQLQILFN